MKHYNLVANRILTSESLRQALQHLTTHACWEKIQTRSGALRKYDQWCFEDVDVPERFDELRPLILALLDEARNAEANVGDIHPIQCFLCLYEDGSMSCPAHTHGCRQLTLSLGATRNMTVNGKECTLKNGDLILLNGERHGILAEGGLSASALRVSINIFYTTASKPDATVNGSTRYYEGSPYHLLTRPSKLPRKTFPLSPTTPTQAVCALPAHQAPMETVEPLQATANDELLNRSARMLRAPPGLEGSHQHVKQARSVGARDAPAPRPVLGEERQLYGMEPAQPRHEALKVCVIGGGAAGLGCCKRLSENEADMEVTMIVEGRGIGGRICTKYPNGRDDASLAFDFGVQRIELRPPLLTHLRHCEKAAGVQLVARWPGPGRLKKLVCAGQQPQQRTYQGGKCRRGGETSGQGERGGLGGHGCGNMTVHVHAAPDATTVVGVPNMGVLGRSLAGSCPGLKVQGDRTARVVGRNPASKRWMVEWGRAAPTGGQARARGDLREEVETLSGEFDVVVLAFEAKKIAQGCASGYKRIQASASQRIGQNVRAVHHHQQWALLIAFQAPTNASFDAADVTGHDIIQWVANNSSKPGREPVPECWVVHTTPEWASRRKWDRGEVEQVLTRSFLQILTATGARTPGVVFSMSSRWGACTSPPGPRAMPPGPQWDEQEWMGACGDWCKGVTVCDAYEAGVEMAQEIIFRTR